MRMKLQTSQALIVGHASMLEDPQAHICQRTIAAFCHTYAIQQAESFLHKLAIGALLCLT